MADLIHFDKDNFSVEVLDSPQPVLVDFTATWCVPCQSLAPIVEQLCNDWTGVVKVGKLDIDENPGLALKYDVMGVPALVLFKGGKPVERTLGYMPKDRILSRFRPHLDLK